MSTQQILGVVGGVVGAFFGYPQLGFVVGSLVGGLLTPGEKTEGPRVDDLKVQVSTYGAGIPILYGTERIGGNVVWSTDKIEVEETTGGKGGAPENTTYRYYVHMGIVLCETPRDGSSVNIVQIFQDGKLIYDARSGIPIGSALASEENPHAYFVLYQGHADQLPDPGEEAWMGGPGSVPAYRGVVRIRMNAIECPGGRVPQFSFVLSTSATLVTVTSELFSTADTRGISQEYIGLVSSSSVIHTKIDTTTAALPRYLQSMFGEAGSLQPIGVWAQPTNYDPATHPPSNPIAVVGGDPALIILYYDSAQDFTDSRVTVVRIDPKTGSSEVLGVFTQSVDTIYEFDYAAFDVTTGAYILGPSGASTDTTFPVFLGGSVSMLPKPSGSDWGPVAALDGFIHMMNDVLGEVSKISEADGSVIDTLTLPAIGTIEPDAARMMLANDNGVFALVINSGGGATGGLFRRGISSYELISGDVFIGSTSASLMKTFYTDGNYALVGPSIESGVVSYHMLRFNAVTTNDIRCSDIITDQCQRVGESRFDVSDVPDTATVIGYKLQNPASARSNVDPLLTAYAAYIVDEDGEIKFKKYESIVSEATISYEELGQAEDGAEPADAMPLNRSQEIDLPRSVSVSYIEPTFDYQTASEKEVRQITEANEDLIVELPMATSSNHAKQVASMILFAKWRAQNTRSFKTSRKYAFLSPGDGVTVEYPRGTFRLWRITSMTDTGALCEFNAEPGDAELYTQTAVGATGYVGQEVTPIPSPTRLQILDMPNPLQDSTTGAGPFVAMDSFGTGPANAELFIGSSDADLLSQGTVSASAPIGYAETVLGNWTRNLVDEQNLFTINIGDDEFSSGTRDQLLANQLEFWACGAPGRWEIGSSAIGDDLGGGRYILSRHLRGMFGTDQHTGSHQVGDVFVLLRRAGMLRPDTGVGSIGQNKFYRAVTKGRSRNSASSTVYANTGEVLKPLAPINIRRATSSNDITLTVDRRSRLAMNNASGSVPLGESTEAFLWLFYASSAFATLVGQLTTSSASVTLTSAQQTAWGIAPGSTVHVRVAQLSDSIGAGHALEANI